MIIYNVTVKVENEIHDEWLQWMKEKHVPDVLASGYFSDCRICRVISMQDTDGVTYAFQYDCESTAVLHQYQVKAAPKLKQDVIDKYGGKFVAFRTLMEVVE